MTQREEWRFWDYCEGKRNLFGEWYEALSDETRFMFEGLFRNIKKTETPTHWAELKYLKGKYKAQRIWELKIFSEGLRYRILGIFGNERKQIVLLAGCYHKQGVYTPRNALDTSFKRAKSYRENKGALYERKVVDTF